jgi:hypothetical protein
MRSIFDNHRTFVVGQMSVDIESRRYGLFDSGFGVPGNDTVRTRDPTGVTDHTTVVRGGGFVVV